MPTLSQALEEAYSSTPTDVVIFDTLEIRHPSFTQPIRVVSQYDDLVATLEPDAPANGGEAVTFLACMFQFREPRQSDSSALPTFDIVLDGVSREIAQELNAATGTLGVIDVTYRPYLSTDLTAPHMNPPLTAQIQRVQISLTRVTATVGFDDLTNRRFPGRVYTAEIAPGLV